MRYLRFRETQIWRPFPLRRVLVLGLVLPLVGAVGLVQYLTWQNEQQAVRLLVTQRQQDISARIQERLTHFTKAPPRTTRAMAQALRRGDLNVENLSSWGVYLFDRGQISNSLTYLYFGNQAGDYIELSQRPNADDLVSFTDSQQPTVTKRFLAEQPNRVAREDQTPAYDPRARPWYQAATAGSAQWTDIYEFVYEFSDTQKTLGLSFVRPYYSDDGKTLLGVLGADFTLEDFTRFLSQLSIGKSGEVFVIDREGTVIASSFKESPIGSEQRPRQVLETKNELIRATGQYLLEQFGSFKEISQPQSLTFRKAGQRQLVQISPFTDEFGLDWLVVIVVPESDFTGVIRANNYLTLLLSLGVAGLTTLLAMAVAQKISQATLKLSRASQDIAQGSLNQKVSGSAIEELDVMAQSFNQMSQALKQSYTQLEDYSHALETKVKERTQALEQEICDRRRSETQYRTLVDNIPGAVYRGLLDAHWTLLFISDDIFDICGYPASDFIQNRVRAYADIIFPEDKDYVATSVNAAIKEQVPFVLIYRIVHADGGLRWVYTRGRSSSTQPDGTICLDGVMLDITAQKQAEQALQHRAEIDSLLSQLSRTFLNQDIDIAINHALQKLGKFTQCDRSYIFEYNEEYDEQAFSMTHEWCADNIQTFLSESSSLLITEATYPWLYPQLFESSPIAIATVASLPTAAALEKTEFERESIQSLLLCPMVYAGHTVGFIGLDAVRIHKVWSPEAINLLRLVGEIVAIAQAKHAAEVSMRQEKEAAELANRAKSIFLANMSHELRSPLNAILGFAQLMTHSSTLSEEHQDSVSIISRSGEHLLRLINNVLDMSKIEAGRTQLNPTNFDLYCLLEDIYNLFQLQAAEKQLQFKFNTPPDLPQYIYADEGRLRQVLINLLSNAIKFTVAGQVMLEVRQREQVEGRENWVEGKSDAAHHPPPTTHYPLPTTLQFKVEDTGPGICPDELDEVFEPFTQTKAGRDSQQGTGLGLTISRRFVQLMGGDIRLSSQYAPAAESSQAQGTVVTFEIPVKAAEGVVDKPLPSRRRVLALAAGQPRYRVLIVDDKSDNRKLLVKLLEPLGLELREARNGQDAVETWQAWQPHLIWMDLRMPMMDGYEATRRIKVEGRENWVESQRNRSDSLRDSLPTTQFPLPNSPIIIALSASSFKEEQLAAREAGCDAFIRKPFRQAEIFETMAQQLGVRYVYNDEMIRDDERQDGKCGEPARLAVESHQDSQAPFTQSDGGTGLDINTLRTLRELPAQLRANLEAATLRLHWDQILQLIEVISTQDQPLADSLRRTVYNFQYDQILQALQAVKQGAEE